MSDALAAFLKLPLLALAILPSMLVSADALADSSRDAIYLTLDHKHGAVLVVISNLGNTAPIVNSRLSTGGANPELSFAITDGVRTYPSVGFGMPAPLYKEQYVRLLPSRSVGVVYHDSILRIAYGLTTGCYNIRAKYLERTHLVRSFAKPLVSNQVKICV